MPMAWWYLGEVPYCFWRSSMKFQGHKVQNITDFDPNWAFPDYRPVAAFKSLRFALFEVIHQISRSNGLKNRWFGLKLSKITRPVTAIKSLRFALLPFWPRILRNLACLCFDSSQIWARITKFAPNMQSGILSAVIECGAYWPWS